MRNHPLANSLLLSDLHLTSNERDSYRWGLFPWLHEQLRKKHVERIFILGDLTEAKDYHAAKLVNRLVEEVAALAQEAEVLILRGNHDGVDPEWPYFKFLGSIPNVEFFAEPSMCGGIFMFPHTRDCNEIYGYDMRDIEALMIHATVSGATSETGQALSGIPLDAFEGLTCPIYAGDIHVPQKIGPVEYVGAPYPIRFGDSFKPRALFFDAAGKKQALHFETIARVSLTISKPEELEAHKFRAGDQYKIRVKMSKSDAVDWHKVKERVRKLCRQANVSLMSLELERVVDQKHVALERKAAGTSPEETFLRYCNQKRIPEGLREQGKELLKSML